MAETVVNLGPGESYQVSARGGFREYQFEKTSGPGALSSSGRYVSSDDGTALIRATDRFGAAATARINVHERLRLSPSSVTLIGNGVPRTAVAEISGGSGQHTIVSQTLITNHAELVDAGEHSTLDYTPTSIGIDTIEIEDALGNLVVLTITVTTPDDLVLIPTNGVTTTYGGGDILIAVSGGTPDYAVTYAVTPDSAEPGEITPLLSDTAPFTLTYTPPGSGTGTLTVVLTVTDTTPVTPQTASITVFVTEPLTDGPLTISPGAITATDGTTIEFRASGGVPPYEFERVGPGSGQPVVVNATTVRYTVSFPPGTAQIRLTDHTGESVVAKISVTK
ncbi:MAG: hypothetical protein EA403_05510 [Spirochaetaceae bacterium]|nr:MAG: hypothetical protein EA403_05510 [Spirochaetaceae bacterium]